MSHATTRRSGHGTISLGRVVALAVLTVLLTALAARLFWVAGADALTAVTGDAPPTPTDLLVVLAVALGLTVTVWLGLTVLATTLAAAPGALGRTAGAVADRWAPDLVRRGVAVALGGALLAGLPVAAHADTPSPRPVATATTLAPAPDPSFAVTDRAPDPAFSVTTPTPAETRTATPTQADPTAKPRPAPSLGPLGPASSRAAAMEAASAATADAATGAVRVGRGDTLWGIAARHLGPGATTSAIAREWPRWYAANRGVIGADPDLIVVGQVLTPPSAIPSAIPSAGPSASKGATP